MIGAGTNRMNVYTVRKATQGLANYLLKHANGKPQSVAIAHDSRNKGVLFCQQSAAVLAANGIKAYLYPQLMPTPSLSFAVRHLQCDAGICVTASHNPAKYNGYKAYGSDGCQVTADMADGIMNEINSLDIFSGVKKMDFDEAVKQGLIEYIGDETVDAFLDAVYQESLIDDASNLKLVYTPLKRRGQDVRYPDSGPHRHQGRDHRPRAERARRELPPPAPIPTPSLKRPCRRAWSSPPSCSPTCCWPPTRTATGWASR